VAYLCILAYLYYDLNHFINSLDSALGRVLVGYRAALQERDDLDRSRTNFLAFVTHELRNPLVRLRFRSRPIVISQLTSSRVGQHAIGATCAVLKDNPLCKDTTVYNDLGIISGNTFIPKVVQVHAQLSELFV
jgi:signal transduction histidine kinase